MKIGDVCVTNDIQYPLVSGASYYLFAICVSVEPFIMVSEEGDMKWSCRDIGTVTALCQAHPDVVKVAMDRLDRDNANGV